MFIEDFYGRASDRAYHLTYRSLEALRVCLRRDVEAGTFSADLPVYDVAQGIRIALHGASLRYCFPQGNMDVAELERLVLAMADALLALYQTDDTARRAFRPA